MYVYMFVNIRIFSAIENLQKSIQYWIIMEFNLIFFIKLNSNKILHLEICIPLKSCKCKILWIAKLYSEL